MQRLNPGPRVEKLLLLNLQTFLVSFDRPLALVENREIDGIDFFDP
jgi:hypothetical protein